MRVASTKSMGTPRGISFSLGLWLAIVGIFSISGMLLTHLGLGYDAAGGSPLEKVHPSTTVAAAVLALTIFLTARPIEYITEAISHNFGAFIFAIMWVALLLHSILAVKVPFTPIIDSFLAPIIFFLLLRNVKGSRAVWLAGTVHLLMAINSAIGIGEFLTGSRLTPFYAGTILIEDDWRSTALLGHPLTNSCLTGAYLVSLMNGGGRDLPKAIFPLAVLLSAASMAVFAGRAASLLLLGFALVSLAYNFVRLSRGAKFSLQNLGITLLVIPLAAAVLFAVQETGFFDQFVERFVDDKGSTDARFAMMDLFRYLNISDYLLAPDPALIETIRGLEGLEFGVESFFVGFILDYGLIISLMFFITLFFFCRDVVKSARPVSIFPLLFLFIVSATSVSLSAKSTWLSVVVIFCLVLLRKESIATRRFTERSTDFEQYLPSDPNSPV